MQASKPTAAADAAIPVAAALLGGLGLLPFALGAAALLAGSELGRVAFIGYGAAILAFLGGARWGADMARGDARALALATVPSLLGWAAVLLPPMPAVLLLAGSFAWLGWLDSRRAPCAAWPRWYARLRLRLSLVVVLIHAGVLAAFWLRS